VVRVVRHGPATPAAPLRAAKTTRVRTNKNNKNCAIIKSAAHKEQKTPEPPK